ncbi:ROK family protein [Ruania halotolerans]|uniref:ROK family protein n=1 Tax=Ruania halotolerans TaxID=2897773 RepID=UPI001E364F94|nr:ROK family protein [Ruania halotolerans]UFU07281.1 ROK family protein [Ruania halotolerans]
MSALLGIDYGGTHTKLLLVDGTDGDGPILARESVRTAGVDELGQEVRRFVADRPVAQFAMTVAGTFDAGTGVVRRSVNMPWLDGTAPAHRVSEAIDVPGSAVQDGIATAVGEATLGAGRGAEDVFVIALGTGIAGAHIVGGEVRAGAHGGAGEVGHIAIAGEHRCSCGQTGCLETWIGGGQLGRRWAEQRGSGAAAVSTAHEVVLAAEAGDEPAQVVLRNAGQALAKALLQVSAMLDPAVVVVGGGVARSPQWTVHPAFDTARRDATFHRLPEMRLAELGVWAGAHGAVLAAAHELA